MFDLKSLFNGKSTSEIAEFLKTEKEALAAFENAYSNFAINNVSDNFFEVNSKQANEEHNKIEESDGEYAELSQRIIDELLAQTKVWYYDGELTMTKLHQLPDGTKAVTADEIKAMPLAQRPMLSGNLMSIDIQEPASITLAEHLKAYLETGDRRRYHAFRQGLDILDYDSLMYAMIDTNPNSMSHWLPQITSAASGSFFKIPKTKIIQVPMTMLQLTRKDYNAITPATFDIVDRFCMKAFELDESKDYFIKTGTYSSKFDFRNAHVHGAKEVRELGEYLLFIHHQANQMASPLTQPCIYGVSTTTEWVVREFIEDKENNPCIYKGLPLHTEYRVFVDFDTEKVIGISPYWESETMKKRFTENRNGHDVHDAVTYKMHEDVLNARYEENKDRIVSEIEKLLPDVQLHGQWSIDVMQNGDDFYIIDMALAENSAFYDCVPKELRNPSIENWLPNNAAITKAIEK